MPAGMSISTVVRFFPAPTPLQILHGFSDTSPFPLQIEHSDSELNEPKRERRVSRTVPVPWHVAHFFIALSGSAPFPKQCSQSTVLSITTLLLTPKTDSSKLVSKLMAMSLPRLALLCLLPPPKPPKPPRKSSPPKADPPRAEKISQIKSVKIPARGWSALGGKSALSRKCPAELIVLAPFFIVAQNLISLVYLLEFFFIPAFFVRVVLVRQFPIRTFNILLRRIFRYS